MADFNKNLHYPAEAKKLNLEGKTFVGFVVGVDGLIYKPKSSSRWWPLPPRPPPLVVWKPKPCGPSAACPAPGSRAANGDHPVPVSFTLPVQFAL